MSKIDTVFEKLKERVQAGEWTANELLPSRSQLSKEYGVSPATISIAMRRLKADGLLQILPNRGTFIPEVQTGGASIAPRVTVGISGSYVNSRSSYAIGVVNALWEEAAKENAPLLLLPGGPSEGVVTPQYCQAHGIRGVIFLGGESNEEALRLRLSGIPVITANNPAEATTLNYVDFDHTSVIRTVVHKVAEAGHRRIGVVFGAASIPDFYNRLKPQFIDALYSEGLVYNINDYWRCHAVDQYGSANAISDAVIAETKALLSLPEPPTAIFYTHTRLPVGGHFQLREELAALGLKVPKDLSLVFNSAGYEAQAGFSGFDNSPQLLASHLIKGIYASIDNPFNPYQVLLPLVFVDRGSIAPPPSSL